MILNFEHVREKQHDDGTHWATYSDLFVSLSFLFLLLYVVASLRTSAVATISQSKAAAAIKRAEQLEAQLAVMQNSTVQYVDEKASEREKKAYESVMDKLKLLRDESQAKQQKLAQELSEQQQKEEELNDYQKTIKSLIFANLNAKKEIRKRDDKIAETEKEKIQTISKLKETEIALQKNDEKLQTTLTHLETSFEKVDSTKIQAKQIERNYKARLVTAQVEARQKIEEISQENQKKIEEINSANQQQLQVMARQNQAQLSQLQEKLNTQQSELKQKTVALQQATSEAKRRGDEISSLQGQLQENQSRTEKLIGNLKGEHEANLARAKSEFDGRLGKFASDAEARLNAERDYRGKVEAENAAFGKGLSDLKGALADNEGKLAALARERGDLESKNQGLRDELDNAHRQAKDLEQAVTVGKQKEADIADQLAKTVEDSKKKEAAIADKLAKTVADAKLKEAAIGAELAKAKANLARRGNLSNKLAKVFRNSGLDVQVDPKAGDMIINFGDEYFDTGRYFLKPGMVKVLNKTFPLYVQTLFEDPEYAKNISAIEIIGFASPTYQDRVVSPNSLSAVNQTAINYNLDLSYKRARSIFNHVFNPEKLSFTKQKDILPLVKVTGRSFFTEDIEGMRAEKLDLEKFCQAYDCLKSQKVIVRFSLMD